MTTGVGVVTSGLGAGIILLPYTQFSLLLQVCSFGLLTDSPLSSEPRNSINQSIWGQRLILPEKADITVNAPRIFARWNSGIVCARAPATES